MKVSRLLDCSYDIDVLGITDDSRNVKNNFLFVATNIYPSFISLESSEILKTSKS